MSANMNTMSALSTHSESRHGAARRVGTIWPIRQKARFSVCPPLFPGKSTSGRSLFVLNCWTICPIPVGQSDRRSRSVPYNAENREHHNRAVHADIQPPTGEIDINRPRIETRPKATPPRLRPCGCYGSIASHLMEKFVGTAPPLRKDA